MKRRRATPKGVAAGWTRRRVRGIGAVREFQRCAWHGRIDEEAADAAEAAQSARSRFAALALLAPAFHSQTHSLMMNAPFTYLPERAEDSPAIDALNDLAFGPGRYAKTAYRLREGVPHDPALSFVALAGDRLIGSVRLSPVRLMDRSIFILGPLAVDPDFAGRGAGKRLVRIAVEAARERGHDLVFLVGDQPYYGPLGFEALDGHPVDLPGPADPARILFAELKPGALKGLKGTIGPAR